MGIPNPVKYTPGGTASGCVLVGNFSFGVSNQAYGPTSVTGFWAGISPPTGGYTVYARKDVQGPSIRVAANAAGLVTIANQYGSTAGNVTDALNWFLADPEYAVLSADFPMEDPDAIAFLAAAGITDPTITSAIGTLVNSLKSNSLWTRIKAFYPLVGGTATTHKYNLKNPQDTDAAFRLSMFGGLTHDANGVTGNGSTGYMDPHFTKSNFNGQNDNGILVYCRNNFADGSKGLYGAIDTGFSGIRFLPKLGSIAYKSLFSGTGAGISNTNSSGLWIHTRTGASADAIYRNGTLFQTQNFTSTTNSTTASILILAVDYNNGGSKYQNADANICTFAFTDGLDNTEKATLSTIVNTFNTTLSRNIY